MLKNIALLLPTAYILFVGIIFFLIYKFQNSSAKIGSNKLQPSNESLVNSLDILAWEFEYARITASEAMRDRHLMINFFLIIVGLAVTGIISYSTKTNSWLSYPNIIILGLLSAIGVFYLLILIQLRKAWHDSLLAMNMIKEFCINNNKVDKEKLATAFKWRLATVPAANKIFNVFFYSAAFVSFLSSAAFACGIVLILKKSGLLESWLMGIIPLFSIILFIMCLCFYYKALETTKGS